MSISEEQIVTDTIAINMVMGGAHRIIAILTIEILVVGLVIGLEVEGHTVIILQITPTDFHPLGVLAHAVDLAQLQVDFPFVMIVICIMLYIMANIFCFSQNITDLI